MCIMEVYGKTFIGLNLEAISACVDPESFVRGDLTLKTFSFLFFSFSVFLFFCFF